MSLFQIKTPCHEDWNSMKIGLHSRHCESCKKDVMEEIKAFTLMIMIILLCLSNTELEAKNKIKKKKTKKDDEEVFNCYFPKVSDLADISLDCLLYGEEVKNIMIDKNLIARTFAQKMPEFPGGKDSLLVFIKNNIKYPESATKESLLGTTIYINFIVDVDGKLKNLYIVKPLHSHLALENEAIRLISSMPNWIPGEDNNTKVPVSILLPIKFQL